MFVGDTKNIDLALQEAEQWKNFLQAVTKKGAKGGHCYIVLDDKGQPALSSLGSPSALPKMPVKEIVRTSSENFKALRATFETYLNETGYVTHSQIKQFCRVSSQIASYTECVIDARQEKRQESSFLKNTEFVLSLLPLDVFPVTPQPLRELLPNMAKFKEETATLKADVLAIRRGIEAFQLTKLQLDQSVLQEDEALLSSQHITDILSHLKDEGIKMSISQLFDHMREKKELISGLKQKRKEFFSKEEGVQLRLLVKELNDIRKELKSYAKKIPQMQSEWEISFDIAAKYVHFIHTIHKELIPFLRDKSYAEMKKIEIIDNFQKYLDEYEVIDRTKGDAMLPQFTKDFMRNSAFKRIDKLLNINDLLPQPPYFSKDENNERLEEVKSDRVLMAINAIHKLIIEEQDKDWLPALQVAVTQTSINGVLGHPITALMGSMVTWCEKGSDYAICPKSSQYLPPICIEIIRHSSSRAIKQVRVSAQGGIDLVKRRIYPLSNEKRGVMLSEDSLIIKDVVYAKLRYSFTLDTHKRPLIGRATFSYTTQAPSI